MTELAPLYGLVVCGGQSSRMGRDKSLISYHGSPQRYHLYHMLQSICERVFISCNATQAHNMGTGYDLLIDTEEDMGPMAALVTAHKAHPGVSFLVVGCDYPLLTGDDLKKLSASRRPGQKATSFFNTNTLIREPLVAIYEEDIFLSLIDQVSRQDYSLKHLLEANNAGIIGSDPAVLRSIDTPEGLNEVMKQLGKQ